ncbi:Pyruvate/Phosphoenolpyruvate kinase-like domain-containing protein [Naematelia encephala]|uniref:Pyruvate/Phosphoenolpyruvate kinase-like domain-containing protein n=1 Tax=Naematelia encephala TaxID=71784 RepID=A0A1Y2BBQ9_9TREE|nr:Pyruvate/Phosphoenolpyruvate kinase-like domain-containing protein [Naematelia encephala]
MSVMKNNLYLKNALTGKDKAPGIGFWLTFPGPSLIRTIISTGGFNWVLIDAEHGQISDKDYYELNNAAAQFGVSPIIRVPNAEEHLIKRALDSGAHGVMTPMCHTVEDAQKIVKWNKYPPFGSRGYGPMFSPHSFLAPEAQYAQEADEHCLVIVQIESRQGVENVEEIAKVPGLDVLFIGPFDLSKFMNVQFGSEEHEAAIQKVLKAAKSAGKTAAIFCTSGEQAKMRLDQGFDMVSICTDIGAVANEFQKQLAAAKGVAAGAAKSGY